MKNNKKIQYALAVLALGIWGMIIYQVIQYYNQDDPSAFVHQSTYIPTSTSASPTSDSYMLALDYPDPFLGTHKSVKKSQPAVKAQKNKPTTLSKQVEQAWPNIQFVGYSEKEGQAPFILLKIDNANYVLQKGEEVKGVKLLKADKSHVLVQWQGEVKRVE